jgi:hypothetical protein
METQTVITECQYARDRHQNLVRWRNLWTVLLFIFGTSVVIFLSISILFFLRSDWLPGAISTLGTIVNGAGVSFISKRRSDAVNEEEKAYRDVGRKCQDTADADKLRNGMKVFGRIL